MKFAPCMQQLMKEPLENVELLGFKRKSTYKNVMGGNWLL